MENKGRLNTAKYQGTGNLTHTRFYNQAHLQVVKTEPQGVAPGEDPRMKKRNEVRLWAEPPQRKAPGVKLVRSRQSRRLGTRKQRLFLGDVQGGPPSLARAGLITRILLEVPLGMKAGTEPGSVRSRLMLREL